MYLSGDKKNALMQLIDRAKEQQPVTASFCCQVLQLDVKRYQRWKRQHKKAGRCTNGKPGPNRAPHRLLPEEEDKIVQVAKDEQYADLSHRQLCVTASENGIVEAGASTFYRVMKRHQLAVHREPKPKPRQEKPEVHAEKPNQIWSWDLTYIRLGFVFVYLFAIIDVYSRKIVGWHLGFNARVASMKKAWDNALANENLIDVTDAPQMPTALSDHGVQMAGKSAKQFFKDLGIKQLFARYQTPTDNAWIETWFRILKNDWLRYKDYVSFDQIKTIIADFITFYNTVRYHGSIDYVTPEQKHTGQANLVLVERAERKRIARLKRLAINREQVSRSPTEKAA